MVNQYTTHIDKDLVFQLREKRYTMTKIGEILGVSKQRIHQILSGYHTKGNKHIELKKYCDICNKLAEENHHIDKNPNNNHQDNTMSLCKKCHRTIHRGSKRRTLGITKIKLNCEYCGKEFQRDLCTYNQQIEREQQRFFCSSSCSGKFQFI